MTNDELSELERLEKAATRAPWRDDGVANDVCSECGVEIDDNDGIIRTHGGGGICAILIDARSRENANLIVAARNAMPKLLTALKDTRTERDCARIATDHLLGERGNLRAKLEIAIDTIKSLGEYCACNGSGINSLGEPCKRAFCVESRAALAKIEAK